MKSLCSQLRANIVTQTLGLIDMEAQPGTHSDCYCAVAKKPKLCLCYTVAYKLVKLDWARPHCVTEVRVFDSIVITSGNVRQSLLAAAERGGDSDKDQGSETVWLMTLLWFLRRPFGVVEEQAFESLKVLKGCHRGACITERLAPGGGDRCT